MAEVTINITGKIDTSKTLVIRPRKHKKGKQLLPKSEWRLERYGNYLIAGCWIKNGYLHYERILLRNLPNDLISDDDLKRFGIDIING
jgi:hypothetical protein